MNPALPTAGTAEHEHSEKSPKKPSPARELFRKFSSHTATAVGSPYAFITAVVIIAGWAISGPIFHYSDTWQLVINTGTTIITFLMVFLIQSTQNRDARAIHLKLDELIARNEKARNRLVDLENCSDEELEELSKEFDRLRKKAPNPHHHATN